ncbi:hypothetical protein GCM10009714_38040 [Microlunatus capsulatus]
MGVSTVEPVRLAERQASRERGRRAVAADLARARAALDEAADLTTAAERYLATQAAALRVAAVVLAVPARPAPGARPRNAWRLLAEVAPELAEWAAFYAATEHRRDALRGGATGLVSAREADDLLRDTEEFLALVEHAVAPPGPAAHRPRRGTT